MLAALDILWPITNVFVRVEHEVRGARHVVLPLSLAHVVHGAVSLVGVVRDVAIFFFASDFVGWKDKVNIIRLIRNSV